MKIIVFGSTGSVGRHLVRQALEEGHSVTAFTRNPKGIEVRHDRLDLIQGDVLDLSSVRRAVRGKDTVMVTLGAGRKGGVRFEGTRNIVKAMQEAGVRRIVCQSTLGVGESWANLTLFWKFIMFRGLIRSAFDDHVLQEQVVRDSGLDWTILRPAAFTDGDRTGNYRIGFTSTDRSLELKISRPDVADGMLRLMGDSRTFGTMPGQSY